MISDIAETKKLASVIVSVALHPWLGFVPSAFKLIIYYPGKLDSVILNGHYLNNV
jgi:hypothetical protein